MYSLSKYDPQNRYDEWNTVQIKLKLNWKTNADILEWVRKQKYGHPSSIQGSIKTLICQKIEKDYVTTG